MTRSPVLVEDASAQDAEALVEVWGAGSGSSTTTGTTGTAGARVDRPTASEPLQEAVASLARVATDPDQRLLVARVDGQVAGAVQLTRGPVSPVHSESAVFMLHLNVRDEFRRHGVGRALVEAAVTWAEEKDITHVLTAASVSSRDANRFMARLGLGQVAMVRGATTAALRAKLPVETPAVARADRRTHRNVGTVLAKRRSMRRAEQTRPS